MASEVGTNPWCISCGIDSDSLNADMDCPKCSNWWKDKFPPVEPKQLELPFVEKVPVGLYRHLKTGNQYVVRGQGLMEADLTPVVFYYADGGGGPIWVRPISEFTDGRFELLFAIPGE